MFDVQLEHWKKTPLVTNTQPDYSRVGNSELVDRTVRSHNWLRTDTIFIENEQIEALANRPPWVAAILEVSMADGTPDSLELDEGVTLTDNAIAHVIDLGANYWSLWNWHAEKAENVMRYYRQRPEMIDAIARRIGYRVRPSWVWAYDGKGQTGLVLGLANDGIAGVPGVLRLTLRDDAGRILVSGCVDAGCPVPGKIRQARLPLPPGNGLGGSPPRRRAAGQGNAVSGAVGLPPEARAGRISAAAANARRELRRRPGPTRAAPPEAGDP